MPNSLLNTGNPALPLIFLSTQPSLQADVGIGGSPVTIAR
ncbi:exported hypothetical protein [Cupriavidus taiwanensis]|uniref:Uncharacterized protein n=1 Tax=Cupriavidus taiwanensis TaxID=164546 RepID=A0A375BXT5_9BURK|nr:exported hypothetical protein [Cupriavidus taiwanensis]